MSNLFQSPQWGSNSKAVYTSEEYDCIIHVSVPAMGK